MTWKTTLAGAHPPALCRALARVLKDEAPSGALRIRYEPVLHASWVRDLAAALGGRAVQPPLVPDCP
eukprot:6272276-Pyramimonas_sp.AAC.1